jgi:predicted nuclease with TOPRIM domain
MAIRELARVKQELMQQNQELQSHYEQKLSELRELVANEKSRATALEIEMKTLKGGYQHRLEEVSSRNQKLESHNANLSEQLENQADELKKVRDILDYLVGEVSLSLNETLKELNLSS